MSSFFTNLKFYDRGLTPKVSLYFHKNIIIYQWNATEDLCISPHFYSQMIFDKKTRNGEMTASSNRDDKTR